MSAYSKNITGSDAFWFHRRKEVQAICEQKGVPTIFYSISCADTYWEDLHRLMPCPTMEKNKRFRNTIENAHLVDWYFSHRLHMFQKVFFDDILQSEWRYHRIEDQYRLVPHAHGCSRLLNDPGLMDMAQVVYEGRLVEKKYKESKFQPTQTDLKLIGDGTAIEKKMITYMDTLVTVMNPKYFQDEMLESPEEHPCCLDISLLNSYDENSLDEDYLHIVQLTQRHVCSVNGRCVTKNKNKKSCRFNFPFELREASTITFEEKGNSLITRFAPMRNDEYMNQHIRVVNQYFRSNSDTQFMLNIAKALKYILKYSLKSN